MIQWNFTFNLILLPLKLNKSYNIVVRFLVMDKNIYSVRAVVSKTS